MRRTGFTLTELLLTLTVLGILVLAGIPKVARMVQRARVNRALTVVAGDLEHAVTIAARQRKPVRLSCTCGSGQYSVADRTGGTTRLNRQLASDREYSVSTLTFSATPVDIFPSGVTSADLVVTLGAAGYSRQVRLTTAGYVRILPP